MMSRHRATQRCPAARLLASDLDLDQARASGKVDAAVLDVIAEGFASRSSGEQIAAAVELRKELMKGYSDERLERMVFHLRDRFYIAVGHAAAERYRTTLPQTARRDALSGEAEALLEQLKLIYSLSVERDRQLSDIRLLTVSCLAAAAFLLAIVWILSSGVITGPSAETARFASLQLSASVSPPRPYAPFGSISNYVTILTVAAAGSAVSIIQRSQQASQLGPVATDPIAQINGLRYGLFGLLMAGLTGPVSALLLIAAFASDSIKLGAFSPEFGPCEPGGGSEFRLLDHCAALKTQADVAKMLIWAFLAGFTERLVPDVLDRFARAARSEKADAKAP